MRYLDKIQKVQIGFEYVLGSLELMTSLGTELAYKATPFGKKNKLKLDIELKNLTDIKDKLIEDEMVLNVIESSFCKFNDIRRTILNLDENYVLDEVEFFEIKHFVKLVTDIKRSYETLNINIEEIIFHDLDELFLLLDPEETGIVTFHIYEKYSEILKEIRDSKKTIEQRIHLSDEEERARLLESRLKIIVLEDQEEKRIKKELSKKVSIYKGKLKETIDSVGILDFYMAKAKLAKKYNCSKPHIVESGSLILEEASNPIIAETLSKKSKNFTPISIEMNNGVTVLTGANMGGKSVSMKTIVLNVLLSQMGFYVFAKTAIVPVYDFIYYISDDMQSIEKGLSTFGAEILKLKTIIGASKVTDGFIALDELARGTNPKEGRDIVQAIVVFLKGKNSHSLISTHYDGIMTEGVRHYQVVGLKNIDYNALKYKVGLLKGHSVDIIQENMDYRLLEIKNEEVPKDALNIASLLGLDKEILEIIEGFYDNEEEDDVQ
ncbi:MAG: MutS-related protein [Filifactoraceae bacterium]